LVAYADFQKSYYDIDLGFFNRTIPEKLETIKSFMYSIIQEQHPLRNSIKKNIEWIDYELKEFKDISNKPNADYAIKDNYINSAKRNISQALWRFHDDILRFDSRMLEQPLPQ
jgi:hypothetical protein